MQRDRLRHAVIRLLLKVAVASAIAGSALSMIIPAHPLAMNVRWSAAVTDDRRAELERQFRLTAGELREGTTRAYLLLDSSRPNIEAIVRNPAVEDTSNIDRSTFRPMPPFDRTARIERLTVVLAVFAVALWEAMGSLRHTQPTPITVPTRVTMLLVAGMPALLLAAGAMSLVAAAFGYQPLWREAAEPNLAEAAYEEDLALLNRALTDGSDPNRAAPVAVDGRVVSLRPLEAAVITRSVTVAQLLVQKGATADAAFRRRLHCLAKQFAAPEVDEYVQTLGKVIDSPCLAIELPES
jgi:hypothetical protein